MPRRLIQRPGPRDCQVLSLKSAITTIDTIISFIRVSEEVFRDPTPQVLIPPLIVPMAVCRNGPIVLTLA